MKQFQMILQGTKYKLFFDVFVRKHILEKRENYFLRLKKNKTKLKIMQTNERLFNF